MKIEAEHGTVRMRVGRRFAVPDAERMALAVATLSPVAELTVDFSDAREVHDAAFLTLSKALRALGSIRIVLQGVTLHHARLLRYLGLPTAAEVGGRRARARSTI